VTAVVAGNRGGDPIAFEHSPTRGVSASQIDVEVGGWWFVVCGL
jgi:hypothetical protein